VVSGQMEEGSFTWSSAYEFIISGFCGGLMTKVLIGRIRNISFALISAAQRLGVESCRISQRQKRNALSG
jgi:hypothetical protein